jgi:hypothetical protein
MNGFEVYIPKPKSRTKSCSTRLANPWAKGVGSVRLAIEAARIRGNSRGIPLACPSSIGARL